MNMAFDILRGRVTMWNRMPRIEKRFEGKHTFFGERYTELLVITKPAA